MKSSLIYIAVVAVAAAMPFRISAVFGDGMVLQRDVPVNVWGWATPGIAIYGSLFDTATNGTEDVSAISDANGRWVITLSPHAAGGNYNFDVSTAPIIDRCDLYAFSCDGASSQVIGITFGDVVFCSGQSNMQVNVAFAFNSTAEIQLANSYGGIIKLMQVQASSQSKDGPVDDLIKLQIPWSPASNISVPTFSATCWYSAKSIVDGRVGSDRDVPLGLVATTWGGTPVKTWTSAAVNSKCMALYPWNATTGPRDCGLFHAPCNSSALFNTMVAPFGQGQAYMPVSSFVWFQGENDAMAAEYDFYACNLAGMIPDWRAMLNSPTAHWTTIQLAPYLAGATTDIAGFRDMQCATTWSLANTSCAVIVDDGDPLSPIGSVHSRNKQLVGRRVAVGMLEALYGYTTPSWALRGPAYASATGAVNAGGYLTANVSFQPSTVGTGGLVYVPPHVDSYQNSSRCPTELPSVTPAQCGWFEVLGSNGVYYNATATAGADGYSLQLTSQVQAPGGVTVAGTRWGYANWPVVNWYSQAGQPMLPWSASIAEKEV